MDHEVADRLVEPASTPARRIAPGGWRRGAVGVALGLVAGLLVAAALPRDAAPHTGDRGAPGG